MGNSIAKKSQQNQTGRNVDMTKKEFIWLGVRVIGLYWLLRLIYMMIMFVWIIGYWLVLKNSAVEQGNYYAVTWIFHLSNFPVPLIGTIYFLFFGTFIYKLINHFTHAQPTEQLQTTHYCEIIVRFAGLWGVGMMISRLYTPLITRLQSALMLYVTKTLSSFSEAYATSFRNYFNIEMFVSLAFYLVFALLLGWYFLKKGNLFINLLNRLWHGKNRQKKP